MGNLLDPPEYRSFIDLYGKLDERRAQGKIDISEVARLYMEYRRLRHMIVHKDGVKLIGNLVTGHVKELRGSADGTRQIMEILAACPAGELGNLADELTLVVNPGATSSKVAVFRGIRRNIEGEIPIVPGAPDDAEARATQILEWLSHNGVRPAEIHGIACRGGFLHPCPGGTYLADAEALKDLAQAPIAHSSNLGIPIGLRLREKLGREEIPVTTTDPVSTDELAPASRLTGALKFSRTSAGAHYCNHRAAGRLVCGVLGVPYDGTVLVTAHLGGGMSVARHRNGAIEMVRNAFSDMPGASRAGKIPIEAILAAIEEGSATVDEVRRLMLRDGGLINLAGTDDFKTLMNFRSQGATEAQKAKIELVLDFFAREISSAVGDLCAADVRPSLLVFTGGLARSAEMVERVLIKLDDTIPAVVVPGSFEHEALAAGNLCTRLNPAFAKHYDKEKMLHARALAANRRLLETPVFARPVYRRKPDAPARSVEDIIFLAREMVQQYGLPRIGIIGANNEEVIDATNLANAEGHFRMAKFLLIGPWGEISRLAWEYDVNIDNDNFTIIDSDDPIARSMELYRHGAVNMLMKGAVMTEHIMRGFIDTTKAMLPVGEKVVLSHVGVFEIPTYPKLLIMSDGAVNPAPNKNAKLKIVRNAVTVATALNIRNPKVAVVSAVEKVNESVQSSVEAREIAEELRNDASIICEGPLSIDVAINPKIALEKKYKGRIQGDADILIMPDIESGNVLYKSLTVSSRATIAGVVAGGKVPLILTSRGDSSTSKMASISLGILLYILQNIRQKEGG